MGLVSTPRSPACDWPRKGKLVIMPGIAPGGPGGPAGLGLGCGVPGGCGAAGGRWTMCTWARLNKFKPLATWQFWLQLVLRENGVIYGYHAIAPCCFEMYLILIQYQKSTCFSRNPIKSIKLDFIDRCVSRVIRHDKQFDAG